MPKRILIENQNAGFGVVTAVPIVRVDPVTITHKLLGLGAYISAP